LSRVECAGQECCLAGAMAGAFSLYGGAGPVNGWMDGWMDGWTAACGIRARIVLPSSMHMHHEEGYDNRPGRLGSPWRRRRAAIDQLPNDGPGSRPRSRRWRCSMVAADAFMQWRVHLWPAHSPARPALLGADNVALHVGAGQARHVINCMRCDAGWMMMRLPGWPSV
jgi:hypothetical protein